MAERGRWVLPGLAAGAVVLVAAGVAVGLGSRDAGGRPAAAPSSPAAPTGAGGAAPLVRDGDRVAVSGRVLALPGRPVRICAPTAEAAPGYEPGHEPLPAYCDVGVTVRGLDLATVAERKVDRGVVTGRARAEGSYRAGVLTVDRQAAPDPDRGPVPTIPAEPPCPAPAGGWRAGESRNEGLSTYIAAHPDQYVDLWITYPGGRPGADPAGPGGATTVPVVGTVLDPAVAEKALRAVAPGNLCVVRARHPNSVLQAAYARLTRDTGSFQRHGAYQAAVNVVAGTIDVELLVLDPATRRWLDQADDRTGTVVPHPFVRPLR